MIATAYYFVPTLFVETIKQKSISINKIAVVKNNWNLLRRCKEKTYVHQIMAPYVKHI